MRTRISRLAFALAPIALFAATGASNAQSATATAAAAAKKPDRWTIIFAGTFLPDATKAARRNVSVIVHNGKVHAVSDGRVAKEAIGAPAGAEIETVDLGDRFVMAGLMDAHVHSFGTIGGVLQSFRDRVQNGATTIRDAAADPGVIFPARDIVERGLAIGPRVLSSGSALSTTAGHGDFRNGRITSVAEPLPYTSGVCDGPADCVHRARLQILMGANQIKIMATAGVLDNSDTGLEQQMDDSELQVVVNAVHLMQRKVMAHAIGQDGIKAAVRAGVDSIEHGNYLDDEGAKMMKAKGTYLVPTLAVIRASYQRLTNPPAGSTPMNDNTRAKIMRMPDSKLENIGRQVKVARRNDVKIAVGTDTGTDVKEEVIALVKFGGMTPRAALQAATTGNADLFGIADTTGTIEAGKVADIIAFRSDPLADIEQVKSLDFVMARGKVVRRDGKAAEMPLK